MAELDAGELTSNSLIQRHIAGSQVVKAFNNITRTSCSPSPGPRERAAAWAATFRRH
ncbi:MAG TPA: hypothetical protein VES42_16830 [Pilimelia sp.]|nr:hypothetical protein [Pilimelia sp.]